MESPAAPPIRSCPTWPFAPFCTPSTPPIFWGRAKEEPSEASWGCTSLPNASLPGTPFHGISYSTADAYAGKDPDHTLLTPGNPSPLSKGPAACGGLPMALGNAEQPAPCATYLRLHSSSSEVLLETPRRPDLTLRPPPRKAGRRSLPGFPVHPPD